MKPSGRSWMSCDLVCSSMSDAARVVTSQLLLRIRPHAGFSALKRTRSLQPRLVNGLPGNGEIITGDIRDCHVAEPVDMVFACYMLFYLDEAEQLEALRKIHGMLAPDGVLVFCQYFPDFEEYQDIFVGEVTEGVSSARYVAEVARACVDAEVLLNRILAHFRSPVY